jgi:hypothetical protein
MVLDGFLLLILGQITKIQVSKIIADDEDEK